MDLQDFAGDGLYFDDPLEPRVATLLEQAALAYADGEAQPLLAQAQRLAPQSLAVLVGLYRFHYYQHRYADALAVAEQLRAVLAARLQLPLDWGQLYSEHLQHCSERLGLLRLYLLALKGAGYLSLRLGRFADGKAMLRKVRELDPLDRLGAQLLLGILDGHDATVIPFPTATAERRA